MRTYASRWHKKGQDQTVISKKLPLLELPILASRSESDERLRIDQDTHIV